MTTVKKEPEDDQVPQEVTIHKMPVAAVGALGSVDVFSAIANADPRASSVRTIVTGAAAWCAQQHSGSPSEASPGAATIAQRPDGSHVFVVEGTTGVAKAPRRDAAAEAKIGAILYAKRAREAPMDDEFYKDLSAPAALLSHVCRSRHTKSKTLAGPTAESLADVLGGDVVRAIFEAWNVREGSRLAARLHAIQKTQREE